jgi:hypothetical protein
MRIRFSVHTSVEGVLNGCRQFRQLSYICTWMHYGTDRRPHVFQAGRGPQSHRYLHLLTARLKFGANGELLRIGPNWDLSWFVPLTPVGRKELDVISLRERLA